MLPGFISLVQAITISEAGAYMSCSSGNAFFNSDLDYSCVRIALYVSGECEAGREEGWPCGESVTEYLQNSGLTNETRLSSFEVAEDFRTVENEREPTLSGFD